MDILLSTLGFTVILGICLYHRTSLIVTIGALTAAMIALTALGSVGSIAWVLYLAALAVLAIPSIRQTLISRKALTLFRKVLPAICLLYTSPSPRD